MAIYTRCHNRNLELKTWYPDYFVASIKARHVYASSLSILSITLPILSSRPLILLSTSALFSSKLVSTSPTAAESSSIAARPRRCSVSSAPRVRSNSPAAACSAANVRKRARTCGIWGSAGPRRVMRGPNCSACVGGGGGPELLEVCACPEPPWP
jgi:hypothetical protein